MSETIFTVTELITPDRARALLERNPRNRTVTQNWVNELARRMTEGRFAHTGQALQIDWNGNLLDGQHRLLAIIQAHVALPMQVTYGIDPECFSKIDVGRQRGAGQVLQMDQVKDANRVAGAVRFAKVYRQYRADFHATVRDLVSMSGRLRMSNDEVRAEYWADPDIARWNCEARAIGKVVPALSESGTLMLALHLACLQAGDDVTATFAEGMITGEGLSLGDPRLALRNRTAPNSLGASGHATSTHAFLLLGKTWNAWVRNAHLTRIAVGPGERVLVAE